MSSPAESRWITRNGLRWLVVAARPGEEFMHPAWPSDVKWTAKGGNGLVLRGAEWVWDTNYDLVRKAAEERYTYAR